MRPVLGRSLREGRAEAWEACDVARKGRGVSRTGGAGERLLEGAAMAGGLGAGKEAAVAGEPGARCEGVKGNLGEMSEEPAVVGMGR